MSPALKTKDRFRTAPLCEVFGITPQAIILQFLIEHADLDYTLNDLEKNTGIRRHTLSRALPSLLRFDIIIINREIGQASLYKFNKNSDIARLYLPFYKHLLTVLKEGKDGGTPKKKLSGITID